MKNPWAYKVNRELYLYQGTLLMTHLRIHYLICTIRSIVIHPNTRSLWKQAVWDLEALQMDLALGLPVATLAWESVRIMATMWRQLRRLQLIITTTRWQLHRRRRCLLCRSPSMPAKWADPVRWVRVLDTPPPAAVDANINAKCARRWVVHAITKRSRSIVCTALSRKLRPKAL